MGELVLILGGARSGKSHYAQKLAHKLGGDSVLFVATAQPLDEEMCKRIEAHKRERPPSWQTIEAPINTSDSIAHAIDNHPVVLIDCVTILVSNIMLHVSPGSSTLQREEAVLTEVESITDLCRQSSATFIMVSNEVGLGIVPPSELGREYRDVLGRTNQWLAAAAEEVIFMIAGLPLELKALRRESD